MINDLTGQLLQAFAVASGFIGSYLVVEKRVGAFYWWLASNSVLIFINFLAGTYLLIALYGGYSIMNLWAIAKWKQAARDAAVAAAEELAHPGV